MHTTSASTAKAATTPANTRFNNPTLQSAGRQPTPTRNTVPNHWRESLALIEASVPFSRRVVRAGEAVFMGGDAFNCLHVIHAGQFKTVNFTADGRGQVVGLHFKGDWLGFDGIASGQHSCDAVALDTGEVWTLRYAALIEACSAVPALMRTVHAAMSGQITRECGSLLSLGTLPADARVANFIYEWAEALAARDLRTDQITVHMSRAEIGNYLGMTLETVSRALSRLAQCGVINFDQKGRRDIGIPCLQTLRDVIQRALDSANTGPWPAQAAAGCRAS